MPGMAVYLDRPPRSVQLVAWGRAPDAWWGCIQFQVSIVTTDGPAHLDVAAWVPAASLTRPGWSSTVDVPRIELTHDRRTWPAPPGWPSWYAGAWPAGPLTLPAGIRIATGP